MNSISVPGEAGVDQADRIDRLPAAGVLVHYPVLPPV